jgi:hypothetical protein
MRRCIHDLVFSETEALDIFGRYVYEFPEMPWQFHVEAARIAWDEARHVELLLNVLECYGGYVGEFPAKTPGYEEYVREPTTLRKILMVNVIAEGEDIDEALAGARRSLEEFKSMHDDEGGESAIPLVRLGADETGPGRVVNVTAKRLLGYSEEEIEEISADAGSRVEETD